MTISFTNTGCAQISITSCTINQEGHLIITYSNGIEYDAGSARGSQGIQGIQGVQGKTGLTGPGFVPNMVGNDIPDSSMFTDRPLGFSYQSITLGQVRMFVKANNPSFDPIHPIPSEWVIINYGIGPQGIQGEKGDQGIQGIQGEKGESDFDIAKRNGFEGSELEWLESLKATIGNFVVDTLPTENVMNGSICYVRNACKIGEETGFGTGTMAYFSNGQWLRISDDLPPLE